MRNTFLSIILAAILGVTLALTPLMILHTGKEALDETRLEPEFPRDVSAVNESKGAEAPNTYKSLAVKVNWTNLISTVVIGAIPAALISIIVKRKLRI